MSNAALNSSSFSIASCGRLSESTDAAVASVLSEEESLDAIGGRTLFILSLLLLLLLAVVEEFGVVKIRVSLSKFCMSEFFFFLETAVGIREGVMALGSFLTCLVVGFLGFLSSATGDWGDGIEMDKDGGGLSESGERDVIDLSDTSEEDDRAALDALADALDALALAEIVVVVVVGVVVVVVLVVVDDDDDAVGESFCVFA